ncbi:hypothetical protein GUITHDRAFT_135840 [Guillardia theta CCMP2712]|uniref:Uncharacterized protein n=1 Tax=Guillardia theta (strain CCMP2712) TaxID=905079 RepID=L1JN98_GUITC|nr:hypothetical protein GUITHDRAFT_135840 [Guillardia theta CCMP2712]EKX49665.1 hypothetical protein GUITHDRAFT_135840 [Guillardia theta CCMP2712]|eukprot:XP_005836645.1 hypothetical protein GUITHDRAFT_135840 [Guillardia theta CCMP2712]
MQNPCRNAEPGIFLVSLVVSRSSVSPFSLQQSEGAYARSLGLPGMLNRHHEFQPHVAMKAMKNWLRETASLRRKHMGGSNALSSKAKTQTLAGAYAYSPTAMQPTISIPAPAGYTIRNGVSVHGIVDIAAPLDPDTGTAVPGIVVPSGKQTAAQKLSSQQATAVDPRMQVNPTTGVAQSYQAAAGGMNAALYGQKMAALSSQTQPQQLAQVEEDEDMYPTEPAASESYLAGPGDTYNVPEYPKPQVYTEKGGPLVSEDEPQKFNDYPESSSALTSGVTSSPPVYQAPKPVPNFFSPPFQQWEDEDAAQHAYNLQQWRLKILQAKVQQAALRKKLLDLATESTDKTSVHDDHHHHRHHLAYRRRDRESRRHREKFFHEVDKLRRATGLQLKHIEQQVLALAHLTEKSVKNMRKEQSDSDHQADDQNPPKQVGALRKLKAHTDAEFKEIMQAVKALRSKIDHGHDIAAIAEESAKRDGGVPAQVALWKKVTTDTNR